MLSVMNWPGQLCICIKKVFKICSAQQSQCQTYWTYGLGILRTSLLQQVTKLTKYSHIN